MKIIEQNVLKTKVMDWNAAYYGVNIYEWMDKAGRGIADTIRKRFAIGDKRLEIAFFCGTGNNGGDGFAAAKYLHPKHDVIVYLFGQEKDIRTRESKRTWKEMVGKAASYQLVSSKQDIKDIGNQFDIVVDCLLGTGVKGKLREPITSAVKVFNKLKAKKVAVDFPTKGVKKVDLVISMQFPKVKNAEVVDLQSDPEFLTKIGLGEFQLVKFPGKGAKKGDAGHLLVISGFEEYHGALFYAVKSASKIIDIIYVYTSDGNRKRVEKLKDETAEFVAIDDLKKALRKAKVVLIGPGLGRTDEAYALTEKVLRSEKKAVLDADSLSILDTPLKKLLGRNHILTPHKKEFERVFNLKPTEENVLKMSERYECTIVLKGKVDLVANPDWGLKYNHTGNAGMTKGGTGDVLAGLIASFYCLTNDPYIAAASGVFVNGLAGDDLYKKVNRFYDAEDLITQLPETLKKLIES